ncbi:MAG: acetyl-CoA carboxylase carboxyltransferase subunit beta [Lentisphaeria bacterium]|nr:acetyl-CoA carboxylase carboxyltransferase subunit beta [Lentisphaeria bacterium]
MAILFRKSKYSTLSSVPPTDISAVAPHHAGLSAEPSKRKEIPEGLWEKCKKCDEMIFVKTRKDNMNVCPRCGYHYPLTAKQRIELLTDEGSFTEIDAEMVSVDTLKFTGVASYSEKLAASKAKTGLKDAVVCGKASLQGIPFALGVMDFRFLGASMGAVVGEKITRLVEFATAEKLPLVIVTASGGARMYEGMISLMQMAKTSGALEYHKEAGLPYIVIMTHPTTAGVTASFASLGDLIYAEPEALIGFAGPRVIKDTTQAHLPEGFQTAEFLLKKGLIDRIIDRKNLRQELVSTLEYFNFYANSTKETKKRSSK